MRQLRRLRCLLLGHRWEYGGTGPWTGYIETCRCGEITQVPQ